MPKVKAPSDEATVTIRIKVPHKSVGDFVSSWNLDYVYSLIQFAEVEEAVLDIGDGKTRIELDRW